MYRLPVSGLLTAGSTLYTKEWIDYVGEFGLSAEDVSDLIRMAGDPHLFEADSDEAWAPAHAWRALAQLGSLEAVAPLLAIMDDGMAGDSGYFEIPEIIGVIGPRALPLLSSFVISPTTQGDAKVSALDGFRHIAAKHAQSKNACVSSLIGLLAKHHCNDRFINTVIVQELCKLGANEARSLIDDCFEKGVLDETIISRIEVRTMLEIRAVD